MPRTLSCRLHPGIYTPNHYNSNIRLKILQLSNYVWGIKLTWISASRLSSAKQPNFKATAAQYSVDYTTLSRQFQVVQRSYIESWSESTQNLTITQEEVLIDFINRLTDHALPPTSQIVKNVAEELCGKGVTEKNWVGQFTEWHSAQLHSGYLRSITASAFKLRT